MLPECAISVAVSIVLLNVSGALDKFRFESITTAEKVGSQNFSASRELDDGPAAQEPTKEPFDDAREEWHIEHRPCAPS